MGRTCSICKHDSRTDIEMRLLSLENYRDISQQFHVSRSSLSRHLANHLPSHLLQARGVEAQSQAGDLLAELRRTIIRERESETIADSIRDLALAPGGDRRAALTAIDTGGRARERQCRGIRLLAELRQLLDSRIAVAIDALPPLPPPLPPKEAAIVSETRAQILAAAARRATLKPGGSAFRRATQELDRLLSVTAAVDAPASQGGHS